MSRRSLLVSVSVAAVLLAVAVVSWAQQSLSAPRAALSGAAGYKAKVIASAVFVSGLDPERAEREDVVPLPGLELLPVEIDRESRSVTVRADLGVVRTARCDTYFGCRLQPDDGGERVELPAPSRKRARKRDRWQTASGGERLREAVDLAFAEPDPERPRRTRAVVVVHRGRIVAERYGEGIDPDTPLHGWSMTKSVTNALAGILVRQGRLDTGERVGLDAWSAPDDPRRGITFDHLLRMTSGLAFDESYADAAGDIGRMLFRVTDAGLYALRKPAEHAPGTHWSYSSGTTNLLSRLLRERAGSDRAYVKLAHEELFGRLGMQSAVIEPDPSGTFIGSSLMYASARDWARFGQLYLQDGVWHGKRVLPEGWVDYTRRVTPGSGGRYGAHFWTNGDDGDGSRRAPTLPADYFRAAGFQGQVLAIVPSRELVVVRLGMTNFRNWNQREFMERVLAALETAVQPVLGQTP